MRILVTAALLLQALMPGVKASTVGWGSFNSVGLADLSSTPATVGSLVRLGFFRDPISLLTLSSGQIAILAAASTVSNKTAINAAFQEFSSTTIGTGAGSQAGLWSQSTGNTGTQFASQPIYYWTYNRSTLSAATQWGIFTAPGNPNWTFPADTTVTGGPVNSDLDNVPVNTTGIVVGQPTLGTATINGSAGTPVYRMAAIAAVPEPSTLAFGALAALAAAGARRRHRK